MNNSLSDLHDLISKSGKTGGVGCVVAQPNPARQLVPIRVTKYPEK